jgi:predicted dehydrogenase
MKICVVGCGGIAVGWHAPAYKLYQESRPDFELAGCCDLELTRAETMRGRFGFARAYTDMKAMLNTEKPDAVCLLTDVKYTAPLACEILTLGYPLLTEKPPGMTVAEAQAIADTAKANNVLCSVAFNRRYMPLMTRLCQALKNDKPQYIRYHLFRANRQDADFTTTAAHGVDAARFIAGQDIRRLDFSYTKRVGFDGVPDIFAFGEFMDGTKVSMEFCPRCGYNSEGVTVNCENVTYKLSVPTMNAGDGKLLQYANGARTDAFADSGPQTCRMGFYDENRAFFDTAEKNPRAQGDIRTGLQSVEIMAFMRGGGKRYERKGVK